MLGVVQVSACSNGPQPRPAYGSRSLRHRGQGVGWAAARGIGQVAAYIVDLLVLFGMLVGQQSVAYVIFGDLLVSFGFLLSRLWA
jgi:hypothetical protein